VCPTQPTSGFGAGVEKTNGFLKLEICFFVFLFFMVFMFFLVF